MRFQRGMKNIVYGIISELLVLGLGLVIPRLFIVSYGSDVNGLFSTVTQLYAYIAVLEAGLGAATIQALYKPLSDGDRASVSSILSATRRYYRRVALWYFLCVAAASVVFPFVFNTQIAPLEVGLVVFFGGVSGALSFYTNASMRQLLIAEGRSYVISNVSLLGQLLSYAAKIVLISMRVNIVLLQVSFFLVSILQLLIYQWYVRRHYAWVDAEAAPDFAALSQRGAFLVHQISGLVFSSTDTLVLSIAKDMTYASVYAVYKLVTTAIANLAKKLDNGLSFMLGLSFHEDREAYVKFQDAYHTFYTTGMFVLLTVCYVLYTPFIRLYTRGADIQYVDAYLPLLFCLVQLLSSIRTVPVNLIRIAGHAGKTIPGTIVEMIVNLGVSIALVFPLGVRGVLLGTVAALLLRANELIVYADRKILGRSPWRSYKPIVINFVIFFGCVAANARWAPDIAGWGQLVLWGAGLLAGVGAVYLGVVCLLCRPQARYLMGGVRRHR